MDGNVASLRSGCAWSSPFSPGEVSWLMDPSRIQRVTNLADNHSANLHEERVLEKLCVHICHIYELMDSHSNLTFRKV